MIDIFIQIENPFEKKAFEELFKQGHFNICAIPHQEVIVVSDSLLSSWTGKFLLLSTFSKPFYATDILSALNSLSQNHQIIVNDYLLNHKERHLVYLKTNKTFKLTEKEVEIIKYLFLNEREISKEELLKAVWNYHESAETHTLETHIYRLRQKIEIDPSFPSFILNGNKGYLVNRRPSEDE